MSLPFRTSILRLILIIRRDTRTGRCVVELDSLIPRLRGAADRSEFHMIATAAITEMSHNIPARCASVRDRVPLAEEEGCLLGQVVEDEDEEEGEADGGEQPGRIRERLHVV